MGSSSMVESNVLDFMESIIPKEPTCKTDIYLQKLYTFIKRHRDTLGYPYGGDKIPYLFTSNDLSGKYFQTLNMFIQKHQQIDVSACLDILASLIEAYDEHGDTKGGCCAFYFSRSKQELQDLYEKLTSNQ